jgi:glycogen(starch) synthase
VRAHGLGTLYRPGDPASLARALMEAVGDYPALVESVRHAVPELSWARDERVLLEAYGALRPGRR